MGKLSDALERHKEERSVGHKRLSRIAPQSPVTEEKSTIPAEEAFGMREHDPKVIMHSAPDSVAAENFKIIRTQLLFSGNGKTPRTIMVTSSIPGEGKSFVAANLAVSLALGIDENVLLVDCDLRRPTVHTLLGYRNGQGLHECLTGETQFEDAVIETETNRLSVLTSGKLPPNPTELLSSDAMRALLEDNRKRYEDRFIIIDSPPCHVTAEAKVLAEYVDGIIFVVMAEKPPRREIQKAIDILGKDKIVGIVFNGYHQATRSYSKYYERYYN